MLVLTRRTGETICIGNDVTVVVLEMNGNQIRLGVEAPKSVSVDRLELRERKEATATSMPGDYPAAGQVWRDEVGQVHVLAVADGYAMCRRRRSNPFIASVSQMLRGDYGWQLMPEVKGAARA